MLAKSARVLSTYSDVAPGNVRQPAVLAAVEQALADGQRERIPALLSDRWVADCTAGGSAAEVRERFDAWADAGVLPVAVMSSTSGGQLAAIGELFDAFT